MVLIHTLNNSSGSHAQIVYRTAFASGNWHPSDLEGNLLLWMAFVIAGTFHRDLRKDRQSQNPQGLHYRRRREALRCSDVHGCFALGPQSNAASTQSTPYGI